MQEMTGFMRCIIAHLSEGLSGPDRLPVTDMAQNHV